MNIARQILEKKRAKKGIAEKKEERIKDWLLNRLSFLKNNMRQYLAPPYSSLEFASFSFPSMAKE
jgi:hypothetical protein